MNVASFAEVQVLELVGQLLHLHFLHLTELENVRLERGARCRCSVRSRKVFPGVDQEVGPLERQKVALVIHNSS